MIEKLKSIVDTVELLRQYPDWVKVALVIWLLFSGSLLGALVILFPKEETVQIIQLVKVANFSGGIAFQVRVKNSTDQQVELVALELSFYESAVPPTAGELQSTDPISGSYVVSSDQTSGELSARLNQEAGALPAAIQYPIPGRDDYSVVSLNLAQKVPRKGSDRFQVAIQASGFPPQKARFASAVVVYNESDRTKAKILALP
jgi:hypothetical protein